MLEKLDARSLVQFHDDKLGDTNWPEQVPSVIPTGIAGWVEANHRFNSLLWNEEDRARRTDVGASAIAASKRLIDCHNQMRNDAVESIDEAILAQLASVPQLPGARQSSETAGAMIDRLSILALKIFHMHLQTLRVGASAAHVASCSLKLQRLHSQRHDLAACLDLLLADMASGLAYFKVYRQFKMYNDPTLNPYLYGGAQASPEASQARAAP